MPRYTYDEPEDRPAIVVKPPGEYDFVISEVFDFERSEKGNEYLPIKISLKPDGAVFENLVFSDKAKFKIDQLLKSIGKNPAPGTAVDFDDPTWLVGCKGRVKIKIEKFKKTDGTFGESNKVEAFLFRKGEVVGRMVTTAKPSQPAHQEDEGSRFDGEEAF